MWVVYTQNDCELCSAVKDALATEDFEDKPINDVVLGHNPDIDVMVQLIAQGHALPVVHNGTRFLTLEEIYELTQPGD